MREEFVIDGQPYIHLTGKDADEVVEYYIRVCQLMNECGMTYEDATRAAVAERKRSTN